MRSQIWKQMVWVFCLLFLMESCVKHDIYQGEDPSVYPQEPIAPAGNPDGGQSGGCRQRIHCRQPAGHGDPSLYPVKPETVGRNHCPDGQKENEDT